MVHQHTPDMAPSGSSDGNGVAIAVYVLYLVALISGITAVIGVVMAYVNRDEAPAWLKSHYDFQIRTFWIGLLYFVVGVILAAAVVGVLLILFSGLWLIIRCAKGISAANRQQPIANVQTWLW